MHDDFKDMGSPYECLKEECAELILALCKMTRFGFKNYNPYDPHQTPNFLKILGEISDVEYRIKQVKSEIEKCRQGVIEEIS